MFLTTIIFAVMSLFYKYANQSGTSPHHSADGDNLHLTSAAEATSSDNQKDRWSVSAATAHVPLPLLSMLCSV